MPKGVYFKDFGKTYVYDDNGKLATIVDGDQSSNQVIMGFQSRVAKSLGGSAGGRAAGKQILKDMAVDAATQLPLALMPGGAEASAAMKIAKPAASLLGGFGLDRILNPDKSTGDSAADALINTGVGAGVSHIIENPPSVGKFDQARGWGVRGIIGGIIKALQGEPLIPEVSKAMPVIRDPITGKWISNKPAYQAYQEYVKKRSVLNAISNSLGFSTNAAIDTANDSDQQ